MSLTESKFLSMSEDRYTALLTREKALEIIGAQGLEKVRLISYRSNKLYFTVDMLNNWGWEKQLISRELHKFNIPLIRDDLTFYASLEKPYPLFVLKKGWGNAVCVSPMIEGSELEIEIPDE